jgi:hypothetical protein
MRAIDFVTSFVVELGCEDIRQFNKTWPDSNIPEKVIVCTFQKSNGDLTDCCPMSQDLVGNDGTALAALIQDGQNFAAKTLKLPANCFRLNS